MQTRNLPTIDHLLDKINYKNLSFERITDSPTLWVSGCSLTAAIGVSQNESYAYLLSQKLNLPLINHAVGGASLFWAIDTLLRSKIKLNDIVVLGITNLHRYEYFEDTNVKSLPLTYPEKLQHVPLEYFDSSLHAAKCRNAIYHLLNFCNQIGAKLVLANLLEDTWMPLFYNDCPNFINFTKDMSCEGKIKFIDLGTDNSHPGPLQHKKYAEDIFNHLQTINL